MLDLGAVHIVATHRQWCGRAIELEVKRLKEMPGRLQRDVLDVEVEVSFQRRVYAGNRRTVRRRLRLVAVRLPESTGYSSATKDGATMTCCRYFGESRITSITPTSGVPRVDRST